MVRRAEFPHGVEQCGQVLGVHVGRDAMTEVEHVPFSRSKAFQCPPGLLADDLRGRQQDRGIEVALQRDTVADAFSRLAQRDRPVHPERIAANYRSFIEAGSDIILTNSFGGTHFRLNLHNAAHRVKELNTLAVEIAKQEVAKVDREVLIAGDIGPTGEILEPTGSVSIEAATAAFTEQAQALADAGADLLWIETISSPEEAQAALTAAKTTNLPIVCTMSFDTNGYTMMGLSPADFTKTSETDRMIPAAYGSNCGAGPSELILSVLNMTSTASDDAIIVAKGNCGIPEYINGELQYNGTPELMATYAQMALASGARIIGGCCGTTPRHIASMHEALKNYTPKAKPTLEEVVNSLGDVSNGARMQFLGEKPTKPEKTRQRRRCS